MILFDLVIEVAHVLPRMTHPELVQALRTLRVVPRVSVPKTTGRMVSTFVRSGELIHVVHLLTQCCGIAPLVTIMTMMTIWVTRGIR
jgi:hypothetical protein